MKNSITIELKVCNQSMGTAQTSLMHSLGFIVLSDSDSIESELQRVMNDIEFIRTVESIGFPELINLARSCKDERKLVQRLVSEYCCSDETARIISESDISALSTDSMSALMARLLQYMEFLSDSGVSKHN